MKPRPREEWILDNVSPTATLARDEPVEMLARVAALAFQQAFDTALYVGAPDVADAIFELCLRRAWRFAEAAELLRGMYAGGRPSEHLIVTAVRTKGRTP